MPSRTNNHAMPSPSQPDIADLAERITALRERIVMMVYEGQQTREPSEHLFRLLRALKAAKAVGAEEVRRLPWGNGGREPGVPGD